jgi:hypothetical protein
MNTKTKAIQEDGFNLFNWSRANGVNDPIVSELPTYCRKSEFLSESAIAVWKFGLCEQGWHRKVCISPILRNFIQ